MKFTCSQSVLAKAINTVSKAVTSRTTIPVLKGILLNAEDDGKLTLSASDLDLSIEKTIDVNVSESGSAVVMAKLFSDIIRKLPNDEILIEENDDNGLMIKTSSSEFNIAGISPDEFPKITDLEKNAGELDFNREIFRDMVARTSFAASIDESKGVITGVLIELEEENVNMVALDGFRMAVVREKMKNEQPGKFIISAKIINEVNRIISESESDNEDIKFILGDKKAVILIENTKIVLRLMEGNFIEYNGILPTEHKTAVRIEKNSLLEGIERASLMAVEGKNNLVKITVKNDLMTITSRSEEGNVKEEIIMEKTGEDIEIGFNSKYLMDALKAVDDEVLMINFNSSVSPCLITPVEGGRYEYLVLPVRISR